MQTYLKVKIKSLATEAGIIRLEERRAKRQCSWARTHQHESLGASEALFRGLRMHRVKEVRNEARASLVAYGFLRGKRYAQIEPPGSKRLNMDAVKRLVAKYGGKPAVEGVDDWAGAKASEVGSGRQA
jgi:hypothetical protein